MHQDRKILVFENSFKLTNFLLREWTRIVEESVSDHGKCTIALSGGKTPVEFYSRLSNLEDFDLWHKTHLFQVDEHYVDAQDKENNFRIIKEHLLNFITIPSQNVHPISTRFENVLVATEEYKNELIYFFNLKPGMLPRFDMILLGCGEDGHIGSLHPQIPDMSSLNRITIPVTDSYFKSERITLSLSLINNSRHIFVLVQGGRKAKIMKEIIEEDYNVPANNLKAADGELTFLLDKEAASELSSIQTFMDHGDAISIKEP